MCIRDSMHTKLLLVDDRIGITGGRNYQDDYYCLLYTSRCV